MHTPIKKLFAILPALLLLCAVFPLPACASAVSDEQSAAIQALLDEACRKSAVPGISVSVVHGEETLYFASGYADRGSALPADESTLYELASVSKAFTGMGILLLEEQGLLSLKDPVSQYIPWLTLRYRGQRVDMGTVPISYFLHHTSGITNRKHSVRIPQGSAPDMLQQTVEALIGADLAFLPGERYAYGTVNYDVLALIIEGVTGQRYEDYMKENVFGPLGLANTFLYGDEAAATGRMAQGYRTSFFITAPYDAPEYAGNKAAGYVISSTADMARWMRIQMGMIPDIPETFQRAAAKSHEGDRSVPAVDGMYYAAGWEVSADGTRIAHAGGNPGFATNVYLYPGQRVGICLLSNSADTNIDLIGGIKEILDGRPAGAYGRSGRQLLDMALSALTILLCLLALLFFLLGLRGRKRNPQAVLQNRARRTALCAAITAAVGAICWLIPIPAGASWPMLLVWQGYSAAALLLSIPLFTAALLLFVCSRKRAAAARQT